jgi:hypothetical protein
VIEDQEEINRFAAAAFDTFDALFYAVKISRSSIVIGIISNSEPFDRFIEDTFAQPLSWPTRWSFMNTSISSSWTFSISTHSVSAIGWRGPYQIVFGFGLK